jgi:phosphomannomutase/phosphoglucomutase
MLKFRKKKEAEPAVRSEHSKSVKGPQAITAKGNALQKMGLTALATAALAVVLGFVYLILLREPMLQQQQLEHIASSYAKQGATNVQRLLDGITARVEAAAQSSQTLSAIASKSDEDITLVEQAMLDYFPEVASLRIIPIGDMGTADFAGGNNGLRNHIEVDMVRRTSEGETIQPQSYKFEEQWLTSLTARVKHPQVPDRQAVVIITIENSLMSKQLKALDPEVGKFTLEQIYASGNSATRRNAIASSGYAEETSGSWVAQIPGTAWEVTFSPSEALIEQLNLHSLPLLVVLVQTIAAMSGAILYVLHHFPQKLEIEVTKIIAAADTKAPLETEVPQLVAIAKQLRRATLRALRQSTAAPMEAPKPAKTAAKEISTDMASPMYQPKYAVDEDEEVADLDLDLQLGGKTALELTTLAKSSGFPEHIFRAYDIRGDAEEELTDEMISNIGRAIGTIAGEMDEQTLVVACDGRLSSPRIKSALVRALMETGRDVIDIGRVPTPLLYYATHHLSHKSGVMITGSHNPAAHNGLKIVLNQKTIAAGGIQEIRNRVIAGDFATGNGRMTREDVVPAYENEVLQDIAIAVPMKIVIDAGNGVTGEIAPRLFEELGCEVVAMNCTIDGNFPNHPPDTSNEANLVGLVKHVQAVNADFGVAFDGDGDRLAVVTASGKIIRSDILLMLYAQDVVSRNPGADVVFDVKCSRNLTQLITQCGGRPVLWKTGHAFMKEKMAETGALLGGEFSGHMFFGERWYGFDDGMYAAGRLAEILSTHGDTLDESIAQFPSAINTPEILIPVADDYKFKIISKIIDDADFSGGKVNTMDGIRVDFNSGWGLIRASNTGPALTARFEADTPENLEWIQEEFRAQIALIDPEIQLNF